MEQLHRDYFFTTSTILVLFALFASAYYLTTILSTLGISGQISCSGAYVLIVLVVYLLMQRARIALPRMLIPHTGTDTMKFGIYIAGYVAGLLGLAVYALPRLEGDLGLDILQHTLAQTGLMLVIVAISEEFVFRGFIFNLLRKSMNLDKAVIVSAMIFASFHLFTDANYYQSFTAFVSQFALGIILAMIYFASGSLLYSIVAHWISDFAVLAFGCTNALTSSSLATLVLMVLPLVLVTVLFKRTSMTLWKTSDAKYEPALIPAVAHASKNLTVTKRSNDLS